MIDDEKLSAYLDGEMSAAETQSLTRALDDDPDAAARLERLRMTKAAVEGIDVSLEPADLDRLDAAVLAAQRSADGANATTSVSDRDSGSPTRRSRQSPRKRGRAPAPYFAAAAIIAVILIAGIGLLATSLTRPDGDSSLKAEGGNSVDEDALTPSDDSDLATEDAPAQSPERFGTTAEGNAPQLFVAELTLATSAELLDLLGSAPAVTLDRASAIADLSERGAAVGLENLGRCLETTPPPFTPTVVHTGTWRGASVFFVTGSAAGSGNPDRLVVLGGEPCRELAQTG